MTESAPALNDPFAVLTGPLAATTRMQLEVVDSRPLSPGMQRLVLTAPELAGLQYRPGQDMMLMVAVDGDRPVRRRYTIRALDPARRLLTLDVVRHAGGPGERWVAAARPGAGAGLTEGVLGTRPGERHPRRARQGRLARVSRSRRRRRSSRHPTGPGPHWPSHWPGRRRRPSRAASRCRRGPAGRCRGRTPGPSGG